MLLTGLLVLLATCHLTTAVNLFDSMKAKGYTKFTDILEKAGVSSTFGGTVSCNPINCYFVLVPTNNAIDTMFPSGIDSIDSSRLQTFVAQHYCPLYKTTSGPAKGFLSTFDNYDGTFKNQKASTLGKVNVLETSGSGYIYWMKSTGNVYYANNAIINQGLSNNEADNGVFHVIDQVIQPVGFAQSFSNLVEHPTHADAVTMKITKSLEFIKFMKDNDTGNTAYGTLINTNVFKLRTVFLPSDDAWNAVPEMVRTDLRRNKTRSYQVIASHFFSDNVIFTNWLQNSVTLKIKVGIDVSGFFNADADLSKTADSKSFIATGGVTGEFSVLSYPLKDTIVHVIDRPLNFLYENLETVTQKNAASFYNLCAGIIGCKNILQSSGAEYTVLAPRKIDSISAMTGDALWNALRVHFVSGRKTKMDFAGGVTVNSVGDVGKIRFDSTGNTSVIVEGRESGNGFVRSRLIIADYPTTNGMFQGIDNPLAVPTQNIQEFIRDMPELSEFYDFIKTGFTPDLTATSNLYTVFAPTNAAIDELRKVNKQGYPTGSQVLVTPASRDRIFRRGIIPNARLFLDAMSGTSPFSNANSREKESINIAVRDLSSGSEVSLSFQGVNVVINLNKGLYACTNGIVYTIDHLVFRDQDLNGPSTLDGSQLSASIVTVVLTLIFSIVLI